MSFYRKITFTLKPFLNLLSLVAMSPLILLAWISFKFKNDFFFETTAHVISLIPGIAGIYLRRGYYSHTLEKSSKNLTVSFGSYFSKRNAEVGENCNIGAYCIIGNASIGDDVMISSRVSLLSGKYQHGDTNEFDNKNMKLNFQRIIIGDRVWIGEGSIVAANIGSGCIVAAGAVVLRNVPDNYIIAGNPMKLIKRPKEENDSDSEKVE
jgi:virginiamycin A acetyltransferase